MRYYLLLKYNIIVSRHWNAGRFACVLWLSFIYIAFLNFTIWQFYLTGGTCVIAFSSIKASAVTVKNGGVCLTSYFVRQCAGL
jgi:hypothetical protein